MNPRKKIGKREKDLKVKPFVEPSLTKRGSLKKITFISDIGGGTPPP